MPKFCKIYPKSILQDIFRINCLFETVIIHVIAMCVIGSKLLLQICERSLTTSTGGPTGPTSSTFVRAEMLPSGYLIRPCEGGGSIIHIVDHIDLDVSIRI